MTCDLCDDTGWTCENHPDRPFAGPNACPCEGAGMPSPAIQVTRTARHDSPRALQTTTMPRVTERGWSREFEDPISLPKGRQLVTLKDAADHIMKLPRV
jgi:hypothetical protein